MKMKKIVALLAATIMTLCMALPVFADGEATAPATTGTITISNASYGDTYSAYKIFEAGVALENGVSKGISYYATETQKNAIEALDGNPFTFTSLSDGTYEVGRKAGKTDANIVDFLKANEGLGGTTAVASAVATATGSVTLTVPYGYYYVKSTLGSVVTIDSTNPNASVIDKNTTVPNNPDKQATKQENDTTTATKGVGETENYTITFNGKNYYYNENSTEPSKIYNYTIVDTSAQLKVDKATVSVKVLGSTINNATVTYTASTEGGQNDTLTISIPWTTDGTVNGNFLYQLNAQKQIPVEITYSAEILAVDTVTNTASFNWNGTNNFGNDTENVKNYEIGFTKVDNNHNALTGAQFSIFTSETGTTPMNLVGANGVYRLANSNDASASKTSVIDVAADGTVTIDGLANGTYYIQEDKAPAGYNKLPGRTSITVQDSDNKGTLEIKNQAGSLLPSTGGVGTTMFYIIGGCIIAAAVVILAVKRRRA